MEGRAKTCGWVASWAAALVTVMSTGDAHAQGSTRVRITADEGTGLLVEPEGSRQLYRLCEPPCERDVPTGGYRLHLQLDDAKPRPVAEVLDLQSPVWMHVHRVSRKARRRAGIAMLTAGFAVLSAASIFVSILIVAQQFGCEDDCRSLGAQVGGASVLGAAWLANIIVGVMLVRSEDGVRLTARIK